MKKFTLIELLVVVAIIGILASMLLPSLARAREKGQWAVCVNNIRQIGLSLDMFKQDNDDNFPIYSGWTSTVNIDSSKNFLINYITNTDSMTCPSDKGDSIGSSTSKYYEIKGTSYQAAAQSNRSGVGFLFDEDSPRKSNFYGDQSKKLVLGDLWHNNRNWDDPRMQWHGGAKARKCNMLFLDGHVELFTFPVIYESIAINADLDPTRGYH